jgi:hypothetical protein
LACLSVRNDLHHLLRCENKRHRSKWNRGFESALLPSQTCSPTFAHVRKTSLFRTLDGRTVFTDAPSFATIRGNKDGY